MKSIIQYLQGYRALWTFWELNGDRLVEDKEINVKKWSRDIKSNKDMNKLIYNKLQTKWIIE